ncbi:MAG: FmdB family zinc ribbon protein [Nitrospira sp.]
MPIYEYVCQGCQHRFEVKQRISDPPLSTCEQCGQAVTKVISAPAIMFKGTGWYVTDYSDKLKPPTDAAPAAPPAEPSKTESATPAATGTATPAAAPSTPPPASSGTAVATPVTPSSTTPTK